jgi:uncharacterized DUF497 family protein
MSIKFEWDEIKAVINVKKHKVSFELAVRAFADPFAMMKQDRFENGEQRWQTIGVVDGFLMLLVAHTVRDEAGQEVVRIISARRAEPKERKEYEQNRSI